MLEEAGYLIVQRYSPWQKKKVRTIIVNAHAKNPSQKSIAGALTLAKPYDRIELTGGEYHESLAIQIPLELVAAEGEDPHIFSRASAITIATHGIDVYMERIVVSSKSSSKLDAAVVAVAGNPIVYRCLFNSMLIGGTASVHMNECTIKDSISGVGVVVQDSGSGTVKSSTIHNHRSVCLDIDTRGELLVTECTIDNTTGGDGMIVSGAVSSINRDTSAPFSACSHVEVTNCHFSILADSGGAATGGVATNIIGSACSIVLTQGAAPTISANELVEGEIGVLIEGPGTARLKGNVIRCQRRCGILALVEEGFGYAAEHQVLRITGDNVLDRCLIGIDVQCAANRATYAQQQSQLQQQGPSSTAMLAGGGGATVGIADANLGLTISGAGAIGADRILSDDLPSAKRAFAWAPVQGSPPPTCSRDAAGFPPASFAGAEALVCVEGEWYAVDKLKAHLQQLVTLTLQACPKCLQPSFGLASGTAMVASEGLGPGTTNPFADVLNELLGTQLGIRKYAATALRDMLQLRGNKGIDIVNTKFSNCDVCAIRFGRQGYGLVEECVFEDCGTYAIVVDCAAHPLITGCRFLRSRGASILVTNFANPFIVGNEMASGKKDGIVLASMSRGLVVGNIITTHVGTGIRVEQHSQPLIAANAISQNRKGGIVVSEGSKPTILFNSLTANLQAQIDCTSGADAFITRNRITASTDVGVHIDSCSRCTVLANKIHTNGDGVLVELDADPYVQENEIVENIRAGVRATNNALGVFVGNRIIGSVGPNVVLAEGASTVFRANRIEGSAQGGVVVCHEGHGFFERNTIFGNAVANVLVAGAYTQPEFVHNVIAQSRSGCGVVCARGAGGRFERNEIHGNAQAGVYIIDGANPTVENNNIAREAVGVLISEGGKGVFKRNVVQDCYGTGVLSQRLADPTFTENKVTGCQMSGLQVAPDSLGHFEQNSFTGNDIGVHLGSSMDSAVIEINSAFLDSADASNRDLGATQRSQARSPPRRASVFANKTDKSVLRSIADASEQRRASAARATPSVVRGNTITANLRGGVLLDAYANGTMEGNDIFGNNAYGVRADSAYPAARARRILKMTDGPAKSFSPIVKSLSVQEQAPPGFANLRSLATLRSNRIHGHGEANVFLDNFDGETFETVINANTIFDAPYGVCVLHNSTVYEMSKNEVHTCMDGFVFASSARGGYVGNHVHDCAYSGVYVSDMARPDFTDGNRIERCGFCGVLVDVGGRGVFMGCTVRNCTMGIVVFCGATTPFQVSHDEVVRARIPASTPSFLENTVEENEQHGVLLLSVISGCPLRSPIITTEPPPSESPTSSSALGRQTSLTTSTSVASAAEESSHDTPSPYRSAVGGSAASRNDHLCASFERNVIRRNRVMGVYHDRFEHWDFAALEKAHADRKPDTANVVKNAYGGYEILLGTSQVLDGEDHRRQRQLKQVSLVENTIAECSIGVGAGYGCHPYLQRNKIRQNAFFGLLLRFGSAVSAYANDICDNGLAGVYAASGAKGYIARGTIESNNGWCRAEGALHESRSFDKCVFQQSFFVSSVADSVEEKVRVATASAARPLGACRRAYEQMRRLSEVHAYSMTDGLRHLAELVSASSGGLTLATGCAPSTLMSTTTTAPSSAASRQPTAATSATTTQRLLGGIGIADYADVSTADGGIGAWVQAGSRVAITGNRISKHQNTGVLLTKGVLQHHAVLHRAFDMASDKKPKTRLEMAAALPNGSVPPVQTTTDIFATALTPPPLACAEAGALFTPHSICATGIVAAVQVAASANFENLDNSFAFFAQHSLMFSAPSNSPVQEREQRLDSIHHANIADNVISGNRDGVRLELFHRLQASPSTTDAAAAAAAASSPNGAARSRNSISLSRPSLTPHAPMDLRTPHPAAYHPRLSISGSPSLSISGAGAESPAPAATLATPQDTDVMDGAFGGLDFATVVEGNTVTQNRRHGVYAVHVASVVCGRCLSSRAQLNDCISAAYEPIRAKLMLSKGVTDLEVRLPFDVHAVKQRVSHALLRKNDIFGNEQTQATVTARYVATPNDGDRTLLQLDTAAAPAESNFASQVLVGIPLMAGLLQVAPPGVMLWEENRIHDGKHGVLLSGYLGAQSVRFQRNTFCNIAEDALAVRGHLACATVGKGNVFEHNGVGLHVLQRHLMRLVTTPATALPAQRTRVFQNIFKAARDTSLLLECVATEAPLVYRNEFSGHRQGTVALYLQSDSAGSAAVLQGNVFSDNYVPVLITGRSSSGIESALSVSRITLAENRFTCNYIGALVCNGAFPTLERNLFDNNARAGLEVVGSGTHPQIRNCVFREHRRGTDAAADGVVAAGGAASSTAEIAMTYPAQGMLVLQCRAFSLKLLPENARVLSATNAARLPAGLLVGPFAEPVITACAFVGNDVGVDAVRDAVTASTALIGVKATLKSCLFANHRVCGVLVRGSQGAVVAGTAEAAAAAPVGCDAQSAGRRTGASAEASGQLAPAETTVCEQCAFVDNAANDGCGDVVAIDDGYATFRANTFCGTVVGKARGQACFSQNNFITVISDDEARMATLRAAAQDAAVRPVDDNVAAPAVVIQEGGRIVVDRNTIAHRKVGVQCLPGAEGIAIGNRVVLCTTGLMLGPYSRTELSKNRVLGSVDHGVIAHGGRMTENEIVVAPIGILVQPPSAYKGINAVPAHKRDTLEVLCARNTVSGCAKDGIYIATGGSFDGNTVSHSRHGITVAAPAHSTQGGSGTGSTVPVVKNCNVFDNGTGVVMEADSESTVRDNDVFDNETIGVVVASTAIGTLQGNRISSAMDLGAVEIPTESRVKALGNTIRNQFSPAFHRGTRGSRAKDYQAEQASLDRELRELDERVDDAHRTMDTVADAMRVLQRELIDMHSRSIGDAAGVMSGSAGHALRALSVGAGRANPLAATAAAATAAARTGRPGSAVRPALRRSPTPEAKNGGPPRARSSSTVGRNISSAGSRVSSASVSAGARQSRVSGVVAGQLEPKVVLIHVFATAETNAAASAIGQAITGVLAKAPLSRYTFETTITTSTSQLMHLLSGSRPLQPALCVVVLDTHFRDLSTSDRNALQVLHERAGGDALATNNNSSISSRSQGASSAHYPLELRLPAPQRRSSASVTEGPKLFYTLVPASMRLGSGGDSSRRGSDGVISVEAYAAAHKPFVYTKSVEDVLVILHDRISEDVQAANRSPTSSRTPRATFTVDDGSETDVVADPVPLGDSDETDSSAARITASVRGKRGSGTAPTVLTTEYVGALFSQLTPEALGFEPAKGTRLTKKRKSSVVEPGIAGDAAQRTQRNSVQPHCSSNAGRLPSAGTATQRPRGSSVVAKAGRRASLSTKK